MAHLGRHVDDRAAVALCNHFSRDGLGDEKGRFDVKIHHLVVVFFRHVDEHLRRVGAGVVDQDIDAVETVDFRCDLRHVADIADQLARGAAGRFYFRRDRFEIVGGTADKHRVGTGPSDGAGTCPAESAAGPGYQGELAVEAHFRRFQGGVLCGGIGHISGSPISRM